MAFSKHDMKGWIHRWLAMVMQGYNLPCNTSEDKMLTNVGFPINQNHALTKRAETQFVFATDKADLFRKVEYALGNAMKQHCAIRMASAWLAKMK